MVRFRIHHALFAGSLGVVGLLVVLIVVMVGTGLRRELVTLARGDLTRQLLLADEVIQRHPSSDPDELAGVVTRRIGFRTTIVDADGVVVGDSDILSGRLADVRSHAERPEIVEARATGQVSFAERESETVGRRLLYAALPTELNGEPVTLRLAASVADIDATLARSQGAVIFAGLLSMLLALAVAYWTSLRLARPLIVLSERAGRLADGDFSQRVPRNSGVIELDELSLAFNGLAEELEARLGELARERDEMRALIDTMAEGVVALSDDARILRTNRAARQILGLPDTVPFAPVGTVVRHPELRELLETSVRHATGARELQLGDRHLYVASRTLDRGGAVSTFLDITEIRRLEQVRRDFVANASHELKTPLTSIRGFAETLLEAEPPPELKERFLRSIRDNTLRLQRMVDDLLDLSRLESGGWVARPERVDVDVIAGEAWRDFAAGATEKEITFSVHGEGVAMADEHGLEQVFRNLFDNAVRYTPSGGAVEVRIKPDGPMVEVAVSDTGPGIPGRALPRIFERFYRADTGRARDAGGTGLGLSIVRHLVEAMGGAVEAESELGRGTTIRFELPVGSDLPPDDS